MLVNITKATRDWTETVSILIQRMMTFGKRMTDNVAISQAGLSGWAKRLGNIISVNLLCFYVNFIFWSLTPQLTRTNARELNSWLYFNFSFGLAGISLFIRFFSVWRKGVFAEFFYMGTIERTITKVGINIFCTVILKHIISQNI